MKYKINIKYKYKINIKWNIKYVNDVICKICNVNETIEFIKNSFNINNNIQLKNIKEIIK